jgi:glycosyltransferase involved in cell wall biosynthesis
VSRLIVIAESGSSGHQLVYVRILVRYALRRGDRVVLALTPNVVESVEFERHLSPDTLQVDLRVIPERRFVSDVFEIAASGAAERLVFPHGDIRLRQLLMRTTKPPVLTVVLVMRDPRGEGGRGLRRLRNLLKSSTLKALSFRAGVRLVWLRQTGDPSVAGQYSADDPFVSELSRGRIISEGAIYSKRHNIDPGVFWFAAVGALSERKNIPMIARALANLADRRPDLRLGLLLAGPIDANCSWGKDEVTAQLKVAGVQCRWDNRLLSNEEINIAIAAADAAVTAYSIHYPNSTLIKAAALGRRMVLAGSNYSQMRSRVLPSVHAASLDEASLSAAMESAADAPPSPPRRDLSDESFCRSLLVDRESGEHARCATIRRLMLRRA